MHDAQNQEMIRPDSPRSPEGPEVMQAFVASHRPFFILVAVLLAQLLLLSFQITRNHNVRLIRIWALAVFDPFERSLKGITDATARAWRTYGGLWRAQQENRDLRRELATTAPNSSRWLSTRRNPTVCGGCSISRPALRFRLWRRRS